MIDKNNNILTFIQCIHERFNNDTKKSKITCIYTTKLFFFYFCVDVQVLKLFSLLAFFTPSLYSNEKTFYCLMK